jgi:hypothetical protein
MTHEVTSYCACFVQSAYNKCTADTPCPQVRLLEEELLWQPSFSGAG